MRLAADFLTLRLQPGSACLRLYDAKAVALRVTTGVLWVTQQGDMNDHIVHARQCFVIERRGLTIVSAMEEAEFRLEHRMRRKQGTAPALFLTLARLLPARLRTGLSRTLRERIRAPLAAIRTAHPGLAS